MTPEHVVTWARALAIASAWLALASFLLSLAWILARSAWRQYRPAPAIVQHGVTITERPPFVHDAASVVARMNRARSGRAALDS